MLIARFSIQKEELFMPGSLKDVSEDSAWNEEYERRTGRRCTGVLTLYTSKHGGRVVLSCKPSRFSRKVKRKKQTGYKVRSSPSRYREIVPPENRQFYGDQRGRKISAGSQLGLLKSYNTSGNLSSTTQILSTGTPKDSQTLQRCWDVLNPGPPYRSGGPFAALKYRLPNAQSIGSLKMSSVGNPFFNGLARDEYSGLIVDDGTWPNDTTTSYFDSNIPTISGYDTLAWDKTKPHVSRTSLAQFIYELKDLPGQLETSANLLHNTWRSFGGGYAGTVMHPRSVADNFLNHEFGWAPFIGDLVKLFDLYDNATKYIADTIVFNNTWMRRKSVLEKSETITELGKISGSATMPSSSDFRFQNLLKDFSFNGVTTKGSCTINERKTTRVWAVGSFKYYRPEFDSSLEGFDSDWTRVRQLLTIYGLRVNPTLLWKITPWTWAVDWFTHVGDFIEHHDEFVNDGIVSRYLYIMKQTERYVTKTSVLNAWSGPRTFQWQRQLEKKQRKVADSPYGFDLTWSNLSARQWAILGAIGITRRDSGFISRGA